MRIENVHIVQPHPLQALVTGCDQIFPATPFAIGARPHVVTCLRGNDQLVTIGCKIRLQNLAKGNFRAAEGRAVIVRQIEMGNAMVKGSPAHGLFDVMCGVIAKIVPKAE